MNPVPAGPVARLKYHARRGENKEVTVHGP